MYSLKIDDLRHTFVIHFVSNCLVIWVDNQSLLTVKHTSMRTISKIVIMLVIIGSDLNRVY